MKAARPAFALLAAAVLGTAVAGGLWRAGMAPAVPAQAGVMHGPLMLSAFLGGVIGVERAVALRQSWAFAAPLAAVAGGLAALAGAMDVADALGLLAAVIFLLVNAALLRRQAAAHVWLLAGGGGAWLVAQALHAAGSADALRWWLLFPVLTIAAERLEMTRLGRRHASALPLLVGIVGLLLSGAAFSAALYGAALVLLAAWLVTFDIARRTVRARELPRFMAVCLLSGYAWLAFGGVAWVGLAFGCPGRDAAIHALGLGFVMSMVMGHAPVILPAVARIQLRWHPAFYAPLVLLHASLMWRLGGHLGGGAALNAAALATYAGVALARRQR